MPIDLISTPGASDANSFVSLEDANDYFETRLPLDPPWITSGDVPKMLLIMATRILTSMVVPRRSLRWDKAGDPYYYTSRAWTGTPSTSTQSLVMPMRGLYDFLGRAIPEDEIHQSMKDATSELAGQLGISDRTLDNDVIVQGIKRVKASSVEVEFKEIIEARVLPDAVLNLLPPWWLTDEIVEYAVNEAFLEA